MISFIIVDSAPYRDSPPNVRHLETAINDALKEGYELYGSPFWARTGDERYPVFYQAMKKETPNDNR